MRRLWRIVNTILNTKQTASAFTVTVMHLNCSCSASATVPLAHDGRAAGEAKGLTPPFERAEQVRTRT